MSIVIRTSSCGVIIAIPSLPTTSVPICGHRQVSFPPVKMLVIVCLFVAIFETVFHLENDVLTIKFDVKEVDDVIAWINSQKSWATLLVQSLLILPTWLVFRFAPGYPRHTLPEGFFLQVFLSVQALLLSTLWRLVVVVLAQVAIMVIVVVVMIYFFIYDAESRADADTIAFMIVLAAAVVFVVVVLTVTNLINKCTSRKNKEEILSNF